MTGSDTDEPQFSVEGKPAPDSVILAKFEITLDDYHAMIADIVRRRNARHKWLRYGASFLVIFANIAISLVLINEDMKFGRGFNPFSYINLAIGLGILVLIYVVAPRVYSRNYRLSGLMGRDILFTADPEGIENQTEGHASQIAWTRFIERSQSDTHFFFWLNPHQAVIVPKRALETEAERTALWELAESYMTPQTGADHVG